MTVQSTIDKLRELRLSAMAGAFEDQCRTGGLQPADGTQHPQLNRGQPHGGGFFVQLLAESPVDDGDF